MFGRGGEKGSESVLDHYVVYFCHVVVLVLFFFVLRGSSFTFRRCPLAFHPTFLRLHFLFAYQK